MMTQVVNGKEYKILNVKNRAIRINDIEHYFIDSDIFQLIIDLQNEINRLKEISK